MELLATAEQMQSFDRAAIGDYGIPALLLMENAGRAFVDALEQQCGALFARSVAVLCGKGHNGGDGFVIARHIANRGGSVEVVLLARKAEVRGDARTNLAIIQKLARLPQGGVRLREVASARDLARVAAADIIVDAIFGTGFAGKVAGLQADAVKWISSRKAYVASVDIASGVHAATGVVEGAAVRADLTVTMGLAKIGHYVGAGCDHAGKVVVADISIPHAVLRPSREQTYRVSDADVAQVLPRRLRTAHKYSVGKVFIIAGSRSFTGAPFMCAQAAMKAGCGAVILGAPSSIHPVLSRKLSEVILAPLAETPEGTVSMEAMETIRGKSAWADVVVVGPGLSRHPETDDLILEVIRSTGKPLVIDADGLNAASTMVSLLARRKHATVLTPHTGELGRLTGEDAASIERERVEAARRAAKRFRSVVALKGAPTATASPSGEVFVNSTGNPGMATIGSGDVLTGLAASFLAQGMEPAEAAYAAVFIHGRAGDCAAERLGQRSLMALDILDQIPETLRSFETS